MLNAKGYLFEPNVSQEWRSKFLEVNGYSEKANMVIKTNNLPNFKEHMIFSINSINSALLLSKIEFKEEITINVNVKEGGKGTMATYKCKCNIPYAYCYAALSTFIPSLFLYFIIIIVLLSKSIIEIFKFIFTILLDKYTESGIDLTKKTFDPARFNPGALTGALVGALSAFFKILYELIKFISNNV